MRVLAIDIGTGTQDILLFDSDDQVENSVQLIMPSPTLRVAQQVRAATAAQNPILLHGVLMGGGPCHWAVNDHLKAGLPVFATPDAALTFDDDLHKVEAMGVRLVEDRKIIDGAVAIGLRDLDLDAIGAAMRAFGVHAAWDVLAVAVFDHGNAPPDISDRKFRFDYLADRLHGGGWLTDLAFDRDTIPPEMTRLHAVAATAPRDQPLLVMDTAPAAILGALDDPHVAAQPDAIIANIGNFHALAFHIAGRAIRGLFEHHTGELQPDQFDGFLGRLAAGTLTNDDIFYSQGHGALILDPTPNETGFLATTGPRQSFVQQWGATQTAPYRAVPHGAMMLAGCFGLLRAVAAKLPQHREAIEAGLGDG
jgi:uncharacterized protein (DUF1786 family)